jgi:cytochrome c oxidase subunit 2
MTWQQASTSAQRADAVFFSVMALCVVFLVGITGVMIFFVVRYRRSRHPRAAQITGNTALEIVWTLIPLVLFLAVFYYGWTNFDYMTHPPRDAMTVAVTARQWSYGFRYPNGKQTRTLFAPLGRPMKVDVGSADVVHGFFIPAFRLKVDAVPGRTNSTWFQATRLGTFDIQCTVICGVNHSAMLSQVRVVPEGAFRAWYFGGEDAPEPGAAPPPEPRGLALMRAKGCLDCHSLDGSPQVGPTLKGLFGRREEVLVRGAPHTVTVDEARVRRAILTPGQEPVSGYPPVMPAVPLTPSELDEVAAYLKALP